MPYVKKAEHERLLAAEEVCLSLLLAMALGELEYIPVGKRTEFSLFIKFPDWVDRAAAQGVIRDD